MMFPLRLYEAKDAGDDGYPLAWHKIGDGVGIKHIVRARAGDRCLRCGHPYQAGMGEWSPCDEGCNHRGPTRERPMHTAGIPGYSHITEAQWRILTVHHLNEDKLDCRWWNLVALCQRDHLFIQRKVRMDVPYPWPHTEWFRPYVGGYYAWRYLGLDLDRPTVINRLDELLAIGAREAAVERMPL